MILVTGGAGYIGSHCILKLIEKGYEVVAFDNLTAEKQETICKLGSLGLAGFVQGSLLNTEHIWNAFCGNKIDAVIHCAELQQSGEIKNETRKLYRENVVGTLNLLDTMDRFHVDKIVFSSSALIYGDMAQSSIKEDCNKFPSSAYAQTKLICERMLNDYSKEYDIKFASLRYFDVAGTDVKSEITTCKSQPNLIVDIIKSAVYNEVIEIPEIDIKTDYVDIEDLAQAYLSALEYLEKGGKSDYFNIGTDTRCSVGELITLCEKTIGQAVPAKAIENKNYTPSRPLLDCAKAKAVLDWIPKRTIEDSSLSVYLYETFKKKELLNA